MDPEGNMVGVLPTKEALKMAESRGLDLVEVSPNANPPVCRIMDFGKFRYDESLREREARKKQHARTVKEVKFHANVAEHDYETKIKHAKEFLQKGHKVKLSLMFRGRENAHRELGFEVIQRAIKDCEGLCVVDMAPKLVGRSVVAMLGTKSSKSS